MQKIERDFYPIEQAADIVGCSVDDLLHYAARKELISVYALLARQSLKKYEPSMIPEDVAPFGACITTSDPLRLLSISIAEIEASGKAECKCFDKVDFSTGRFCTYEVAEKGRTYIDNKKVTVAVTKEKLVFMATELDELKRLIGGERLLSDCDRSELEKYLVFSNSKTERNFIQLNKSEIESYAEMNLPTAGVDSTYDDFCRAIDALLIIKKVNDSLKRESILRDCQREIDAWLCVGLSVNSQEFVHYFAQCATNFGEPIDRQKWARYKSWSREEAAFLMFGIEPSNKDRIEVLQHGGLRFKGKPEKSSTRYMGNMRIEEVMEVVDSTIKKMEREGVDCITPAEWLEWAIKNDAWYSQPDYLMFGFNQFVEAWRYRQQEMEKEQLGRYTIQEAAKIISDATGERYEALLKKINDAVNSGLLKAYESGRKLIYRGSVVRDFYEEIYWNDLNKWLEENESRVEFRFSEPIANNKSVNNSKEDEQQEKKLQMLSEVPQAYAEPVGGDALTPIIWTICNEFSNQSSFRPRDVLKELQRRANSDDENLKLGVLLCSVAGGIKYELHAGDEKELSQRQLYSRISEWKKKKTTG